MSIFWKNKNILKLIISAMITRFGDSVETIAFSWIVYEITGSLSIMGLVFALNFIPNIIFSPFAGVFADRHNRKWIVVISDIIRGVNALIITVFIFTGTANVLLIVLFSFINSTFESFASPARVALYADIIDKEDFLKVTSISSSASSAAELVGLGAAGIIVAFGGNEMAFFIDACTFLISAFGIFLVTYNYEPKDKEDTTNTYFKDIQIGFKILVDDRLLTICIVSSALLNFFFTPLNVLLPAYSNDFLKMGIKGVSLIETAITIGMIIGGILIATISKKFKLSSISITGFFTLGFTYFLLGMIPLFNLNIKIIIGGVAIVSFFFGLAVPAIAAPIRTHVIRVIPDDKRGIISSMMSTTALIAIPLGGAIVGAIGDLISVDDYFFMAAFGIILLTGFLFTNKKYREI